MDFKQALTSSHGMKRRRLQFLSLGIRGRLPFLSFSPHQMCTAQFLDEFAWVQQKLRTSVLTRIDSPTSWLPVHHANQLAISQ